jgi:hypothetical protein
MSLDWPSMAIWLSLDRVTSRCLNQLHGDYAERGTAHIQKETALSAEEELVRELVALRRGWALQATGLRARIGPRLALVCGVGADDNDRVIRHKVRETLARLYHDVPRDLKLAMEVSLALEPRAQHGLLTDRLTWLAGELHCEPRTARRRSDHACKLIAQIALQQDPATEPVDDPEKGWYVRRLRSLLRLDTPTPELYEERVIVATRDNLSTLGVRFSLPRRRDDDSIDHDLIADVLHGARILSVEQLGEAHFRYTLALPRVLNRGDDQEYMIMFRIPEHQPMRSYYAFAPLIPCESFQLRVRFPADRVPRSVWRLDRVPPRLLDEDRPGGTPLIPDQAGELSLDVSDLELGFGYGIAWSPDTTAPLSH